MNSCGRFLSALLALLFACALTAEAGAFASEGDDDRGLSVLLPGGTAETFLSLADLQAMPWTTVTTANHFNDGPVTYRGPLVRDVLAAVGLGAAERVRFIAANDYSVDIPTSDFKRWDVILAMEANGAPLPLRETGPIWLMYPLSSDHMLDEAIYNQRLIWQVIRLEAL